MILTGAKNAQELASLIGDKAKQSGNGYITNCPCHHDEHPSLYFFDSEHNGITYIHFKCYVGCSHPDVKKHFQDIGFLVKPEEYHISTTPSTKLTTCYNQPAPHNPPQQAIKKVQTDCTEIYEYFLSLLDDTEAIRCMERMGIPKEITRWLGITTLPKDTRAIQADMIKKFGIDRLVESGILVLNEKGNLYIGLFSHRLLFPHSYNGKIETIQGRLIDPPYNEDTPKTKNLKGREITLYNKRALQDAMNGNKKLLICEGAKDVASVYALPEWVEEYGHPIGLSGVGNAKDLINLVRGLQVTIASDNDFAGINFRDNFSEMFMRIYHRAPHSITFKIEGVKDINDYLCYRRRYL